MKNLATVTELEEICYLLVMLYLLTLGHCSSLCVHVSIRNQSKSTHLYFSTSKSMPRNLLYYCLFLVYHSVIMVKSYSLSSDGQQ